ncbi:hypothetical protein VTO73DRAFT_9835 [Trametes versicolor]
MAEEQAPSLIIPQIPSLDNTFGAIVIGTYVGLILYGVTIHQAYRYSRLYPNDSWWLKGLVIVVLVLESLTSVLGMHGCYYHLVTNYFQPEKLGHPVWSINLSPTISGLSVITAQSFFIRRVWVIGARFRPVVIVSESRQLRQPKDSLQTESRAYLLYRSALALVSDLLLASVLIHVLHRNRTGFKRTDSMIDLMIMYSVSTGLITGIVDILAAGLAFAFPQQLLYIPLGVAGTKLYANAVLAALNSRQYIALRGGSNVVSNEVSAFGFAPPPGGSVSEIYTPQLRRSMRATIATDAPAAIELKVST